MLFFSSKENREQTAVVTKYSFVHLLFGFLWYWIFSIIKKKELKTVPKRDKKQREKKLLLKSFLLMFGVHLIFEYIENSKFGINFFRQFGWRKYGGDHILNQIGDHIFAIIGFWIGYAIFK